MGSMVSSLLLMGDAGFRSSTVCRYSGPLTGFRVWGVLPYLVEDPDHKVGYPARTPAWSLIVGT